MKKVFISHAHQDTAFVVDYLKPLLEGAGLATWCSGLDPERGLSWQSQLRDELAKADWLLVILSPDAASSEWVRSEINWAIDHLPGKIVPVMARACDPTRIHLRLGITQFVDFRIDRAAAGQKLIAWLKEEAQQAADPEFDHCAQTAMMPASGPKECKALLTFELALVDEPPREIVIEMIDDCVIGRAVDAGLPIPRGDVSRRHARLTVHCSLTGKELEISDLRSTNGTFVNNTRVTDPRPLNVGDVVAVGASRLHLRYID